MVNNDKIVGKNTWITSYLYYLGTIVLGIEIPRISYRRFILDIFENGKDSFLHEYGLVDINDSIFNFHHLITNYFPIVIFMITLILLSSKEINFKRTIIIWATSILSFLLTFFVSNVYLDYSKSWYFIPQVGILISFTLIAISLKNNINLTRKGLFFFSGLVSYSFLSKAFEPLVMKLKFDMLDFPFGKIHFVIFCLYAISSFLFYYQKKKDQSGIM